MAALNPTLKDVLAVYTNAEEQVRAAREALMVAESRYTRAANELAAILHGYARVFRNIVDLVPAEEPAPQPRA